MISLKAYFQNNRKESGLTLLVVLLAAIAFQSCSTNPNYSDIPVITFKGFSKDSLLQGTNNTDSIKMYIDFTDGDGDIGNEGLSSTLNLFLTDTRTGKQYGAYRVPSIPTPGANNGVEGTITINLFNTCCTFPDNIVPCSKPPQYPNNDLGFELYFVDRAGNKSNVVKTSTIKLLCK